MTSPIVQLQQLNSVPIAVIRAPPSYRASFRCAVGWSGTQYVRSKRRAVATSPSIGTAPFVSRWGSNFLDHLLRTAKSSSRQHPLAQWHRQPTSAYSGLGAAHDAIRQWCRANNHNLAGPNWEIYGHWQPEWNTDPSQIRTDVYYQLAR